MGNQVKDNNYFVVHGWMRNLLGLRGNALDIYAIIYGFSQADHQEFTASINYLCEWLGVSRPTIINNLKDLVDRGLLTKESEDINGVTYCRYRAVIPDEEGSKKTLLPQSKNFTGGSQKTLLNNKQDKEQDKEKPFSTKKGGASKKSSSYDTVFSAPENEVIKEALIKWVNVCKGRGVGFQYKTLERWASVLRDNAKDNPEIALAIVDQSIEAGWKDLYALKKKPKEKPRASMERFDPEKDKVATGTDGKPLVY